MHHSVPSAEIPSSNPQKARRASRRVNVTLPARLTWKDQQGSARFATVVTRNVSEHGVLVECQSAFSIPLYRIVHFQLERDAHETEYVPVALRQGRILSAVYRVSPATKSGTPQCLALRLMVDPKRQPQAVTTETRATA